MVKKEGIEYVAKYGVKTFKRSPPGALFRTPDCGSQWDSDVTSEQTRGAMLKYCRTCTEQIRPYLEVMRS